MAGSRRAGDQRLYTGGLVFAVWLAGLVAVGMLLSMWQQGATASAPATLSSPGLAPVLAPAETLPPTVVVGERADAYAPDCGRSGARPADRRCRAGTPRLEPVADRPQAELDTRRRTDRARNS